MVARAPALLRAVAVNIARLLGVLLLVSVLAFLALRLTPGDPAQLMIGPQAGSADVAQRLEQLRVDMGLDQPLPVQYGRWIGRLASGEFGESNRSGVPVLTLIGDAAPVTAWLVGLSVLVSVPLSIVLGMLAAAFHRRLPDRAIRLFLTLGLTTPAFWLGIILLNVFAVSMGWFPTSGYVSPLADPGGFLSHMALPVLALSLFLTGTLARYVYAEATEVLAQDYIRTARAMGIPERQVLLRFAARNALIPLIAVTGVQLAALVGGAVLVEQVFGLPGVGQLMLTGVLGRDYQIVQGAVMIATCAVLVITTLADVAYRVVDPRLKVA